MPNYHDPIKLSIKFLGPVLKLNVVLSNQKKQFIYAGNGIGKSFITRAFHYLDAYQLSLSDDTSTDEQAVHESFPRIDFASEESPDGGSYFSIQRGSDKGEIILSSGLEPKIHLEGFIFHVFSEEFVNDELKLKEFKNLGKSEKKIIFDKNIGTLDDLDETIPDLGEHAFRMRNDLGKKFNSQINTKLINELGIDENILHNSDLNVNELIAREIYLSALEGNDFENYHKTILELKRTNKEIIVPKVQEITLIEHNLVDLFNLPDYKKSYDVNINILGELEGKFTTLVIEYERQRSFQQKLATSFPKIEFSEYKDYGDEIESVFENVKLLKNILESREEMKTNPSYLFFEPTIIESILTLNTKILKNNNRLDEICTSINEKTELLYKLEFYTCNAFKVRFHEENYETISQILETEERQAELIERRKILEKSVPSLETRYSVSESFNSLLRMCFGKKYYFDPVSYSITLNGVIVKRSLLKTISEGEKNIIAFCYFLSSIHTKIKNVSDYKKIFLIIDDPVTSISHEFIYKISQILKNLHITKFGKFEFEIPKTQDESELFLPFIILTHNSYFSYLLLSNNVVGRKSGFLLYEESGVHKLTEYPKLSSTFQVQLFEVYCITKGKSPNIETGNTVRSVLESIGRFCYPNFINLTNFLKFLARDKKIDSMDVILHSLSHAFYDDGKLPLENLRQACEETLKVVKLLTPGQLELIKSMYQDPNLIDMQD